MAWLYCPINKGYDMMIQGAICVLIGFLTCLFIHKPSVLRDLLGDTGFSLDSIDWYVWIAIAGVALYFLGKQILNFLQNSERELIFKFIKKSQNTVTAGEEGRE